MNSNPPTEQQLMRLYGNTAIQSLNVKLMMEDGDEETLRECQILLDDLQNFESRGLLKPATMSYLLHVLHQVPDTWEGQP